MQGLSLFDSVQTSPDGVSDPNWKVVGSCDFDRDGRPDLLWHEQTQGWVVAWLMTGATLKASLDLTPGQVPDTRWQIVGTGDANGDGNCDIFWQHRSNDGWLAVWLMQGLNLIDSVSLTPDRLSDPSWHVVGTGDFNADGSTDLVWRQVTTGYVAVWIMNGTTLVESRSTYPNQVADLDWRIAGTGDFNADGQWDLLWWDSVHGYLSAWLMNGTTLLESRAITPDGVADVNWRPVVVAPPIRQLRRPSFYPAPGQYGADQSVSMTSTISGADVYYTKNGAEPDPSVSPIYSTPVAVTENTTLKAKTVLTGWVDGGTTSGLYEFTVAPVLFSHSAGTYDGPIAVSLSNATAGAVIRYTTDGATPTESSAIYAGAIAVDRTMTVRASAFRTGWYTAVWSATYTFVTRPPVLDPPPGVYQSNPPITMTTPTPGAAIRFTTNGTDPTEASTLYTGPLAFSDGSNVLLQARAFRAGWSASTTAGGTYAMNQLPAPTPVASPSAGTYDIGQVVSLSVAEPGFAIFYTLDGSEPTAGSIHYSAPITLTQPTTIKAKAFGSGYAPTLLTAVYAIRVAMPTMTPEAGEYDPMPVISISATPGATIRYTTDRNEPTASSPIYTGSLIAGSDMTVKAQAHLANWAPSRVVTQTYLSSVLVETGSPAVVTFGGATETGLSATGGSVSFLVSGASLSSDPGDAWVYRNSSRIPASQVQVASNGVTVPGILAEGRNALELEAIDSNGYLVYDSRTVWAGSRVVTVTVQNAAGQALPGATVTASLDEAGSVTASGTTSGSGQAVLQRLPVTSVLNVGIEADGYRPALVSVPIGQGSLTVRLDLANNDFSQDVSGWTVGTTYAYTVDHVEASQPLVPCPACVTRPGAGNSLEATDEPASSDDVTAGTMSATSTDRDLLVNTMNRAGAQSVTRRFTVAPGTTDVAVRYRFQSDERRVALTTGTYHNDWYEVKIRALGTGVQVQDVQSVQSLWWVFDANHATPWYTLRLPGMVPGDTVEVTLTAANAVDNAYLGLLYADVVQETVHEITAFQLNALHHPTDQYRDVRPITPLDYVSASPHAAHLTSYGGFTRFHGTVTVRGPATATLQDMWLEIVEGTTVIRADLARASVSPARGALLGQQFGADGEISVTASTLLFELSAAQAAVFDQNTDRNDLVARVVSLTTSGIRRERRLDRFVNKLVQYTDPNRTAGTGRDLGDCVLSVSAAKRQNRPVYPCGGDSWVLPSVRGFISLTPTTMT